MYLGKLRTYKMLIWVKLLTHYRPIMVCKCITTKHTLCYYCQSQLYILYSTAEICPYLMYVDVDERQCGSELKFFFFF